MRFERLLECVGDKSIFTTQQVLDAGFEVAETHKQLARWSRAGKLCQLRRGIYAVARPYCLVEPHPFEIANALDPDSYVSLDTALRWHVDPNETPAFVRSVTPHRTNVRINAFGVFEFHHLYADLLRIPGTVSPNPRVACREKAYLDMVQQQRADRDSSARLAREFSWSGIDAEHLFDVATWTGVSRLKKAAGIYRGICDHRKRLWGGVLAPAPGATGPIPDRVVASQIPDRVVARQIPASHATSRGPNADTVAAPTRFARRAAAMVESECSGKVRDDAFSAT